MLRVTGAAIKRERNKPRVPNRAKGKMINRGQAGPCMLVVSENKWLETPTVFEPVKKKADDGFDYDEWFSSWEKHNA